MSINHEDMTRQLKGHLQSLRQAGIEWLPRATTPLVLATVTPDIPVASRAATVVEASAAPAGGSVSGSDRRLALQMLAQEVAACGQCAELASTRTQTVFADGQLGAELCFIGEAPGADEDAQGLPFVGAAGNMLNKIITGSGFTREEVYICNILKCRPPGNRAPLPNEAANCRGFLERQLGLLQPRFICALGGCAAQNLLNTTTPIGKLRGRFHDYRGIPVMVTYHPAYLLPHRSPEKKREVWEDMKMLLARMGRPIPQQK